MGSDHNALPVAFNHIGIGVSDIEAAVEWYRSILGFRLVSGPFEVRSDGPHGTQAVDVLGLDFRHMRQAHMTSANGIGLELFELIDPPHEHRPDVVEYWKSGPFHFCVTHPDVAGLVARIVEAGGRQLSKVWNERGGGGEYLMCYCRDPFGCVVEIYSHSYEMLQGHR